MNNTEKRIAELQSEHKRNMDCPHVDDWYRRVQIIEELNKLGAKPQY